MSELVLSNRDFDLLRGLIEGWCGIVVDHQKTYLIETRLRHLVGETGCASYGQFYEKAVAADADLQERIIDSITTNETSWFRDRGFYDSLRARILPETWERARAQGQRRIRIWSAACSTGQEPYSIAILLREMERLGELPLAAAQVADVFATDVCQSALTIARAGRYDPISMRRGLPAEFRERYFDKDGRVGVLRSELRDAVHFRRFNLLEPMELLGTFDLVLMRNVMIYFSPEVRKRVLSRVLHVLRPDAAFAAGATESVETYSGDYECIRDETSTYYRAKCKEEGEPR
jgi:chemotaxis protein methyltransferase CheR